MADAESGMPASKKRAAGREISKDNPGLDDDDENVSEQEMGTFKKASEEVLATRRIVKVRRQTTSAAALTSNPFAGIQLVPTKAVSVTPIVGTPAADESVEVVKGTDVAEDKGLEVAVDKAEKEVGGGILDTKLDGNGLEKKEIKSVFENENTVAESDIDSKKETQDVKDSGAGVVSNESKVNDDVKEAELVEERDDESKVDKSGISEAADVKDNNKADLNSNGGASNVNPFLQLSGSKNAFTGFTGTGFSGSSFAFNPISSEGTPAGTDSGPSTGQKTDQPLFNFGFSANNGSSSLFGAKDSSLTKSQTTGISSLQEVHTETGEENESVVFSANSALFEYLDGGWKERGRGEVKINVSTLEGSRARLVMRTKGNLRLILNASLYPEMKLAYMDKKGITFACINSNDDAKGKLSTYALKFKDGSVADEFHAVVTSHKATITNTPVLKTPENSPQ